MADEKPGSQFALITRNLNRGRNGTGAAALSAAAKAEKHREGAMHAFIIEDDYLIGQSLCDMLEPLGFERFSFARSEDAAVLGAGSQPIDLITADVRLLPGDGVNAVNAICERRDIPVLFITAYADELLDRVPDAIVVQKPVKENELAEAVQKVLTRHAQNC